MRLVQGGFAQVTLTHRFQSLHCAARDDIAVLFQFSVVFRFIFGVGKNDQQTHGTGSFGEEARWHSSAALRVGLAVSSNGNCQEQRDGQGGNVYTL